MAPPAFASAALTWWSAMYTDHQAVSVTVRFLHLAGILVGGGTAPVSYTHLTLPTTMCAVRLPSVASV